MRDFSENEQTREWECVKLVEEQTDSKGKRKLGVRCEIGHTRFNPPTEGKSPTSPDRVSITVTVGNRFLNMSPEELERIVELSGRVIPKALEEVATLKADFEARRSAEKFPEDESERGRRYEPKSGRRREQRG